VSEVMFVALLLFVAVSCCLEQNCGWMEGHHSSSRGLWRRQLFFSLPLHFVVCFIQTGTL